MEGRCKRHPKHKQAKGVCPYCLRERLSHLSASSSSSNTTLTSSSSSSAYSSDDDSELSSYAPSPPWKDLRRLRPMGKSLSMAFETRGHEERSKEDMKKKKKKKKGGFWSKLLVGNSKRKEAAGAALFHSKTMKERSSMAMIS
ncbi:uncharacterized protein LOC120250097 [Dioscorea cayenensis subsp. rotundata]|uniref:Uncharacterized protein LOC120250097 n=1 Tax=Dioscorea cayennensis subsp. rotundata TaxID=55577 RepID=A0AB40AIW9_DIOCR|nr:uncharacterized protein LOC120250097 [Dioscorea cayenensis subsp. rotundata]